MMKTVYSAAPTLLRILIVVACLPVVAMADGGFFAPWQHEIYETEQIAFISYDAQTDVEILHILPKFEGNAYDFAWIVPTPTLPDLSESDLQIFYDCQYVTAPVWRNREGAWGCEDSYMTADYAGGRPADDNVVIVEEQLVGIFQTMTISAEDASALTDSLTAWGFLHQDNQAEAEQILAAYVEEDWYFVTLKVDPSSFDQDINPDNFYWYGGIEPIRLTFTTEQIVYPLRISAISAANVSDVVLYVAAANRLTFPGAETTYANRISIDELMAIRDRHGALGIRLDEGDFLTRLRKSFTPEEMDQDIVLTPAANNNELRLIHYSGIPLSLGLVLAAAAGLRLRYRKRRFEE